MRSAAELGEIIRSRRKHLGFKQADVLRIIHATTGPKISEAAYRQVETGRTSATSVTLTAISRGLRWPLGALAEIQKGADPAQFHDEDHEGRSDVVRAHLRDGNVLDYRLDPTSPFESLQAIAANNETVRVSFTVEHGELRPVPTAWDPAVFEELPAETARLLLTELVRRVRDAGRAVETHELAHLDTRP